MVARYRGTVKWRYFRGDAAFANLEIYEFLEADPKHVAADRAAMPPSTAARTRARSSSE